MKILLAFSWGHQFPNPGLSNEMMAGELAKIQKGFDFVLVQAEIDQAMNALQAKADYVVGSPGLYLNTYQVAKAMQEWMKNRNIDLPKAEIKVLCHQTHWAGLKLILRKLNIPAERINVNVPHDPNSSQWYTRGPLRAFAGKLLHVFGYLFRGELF